MNISFVKKAIIFLIVFILIFESVNILKPPKKAEAIFCSNCSTLINDIAEWVTHLGEWAQQVGRWAKEDLMASMTDFVAKRIVDYMVDQTIVWIQGGGSPQFVSDWDGFLKTAGNIAFDQVVKDVGLAFICSPFKLQVQLSLIRPGPFSQKLDCTLDKVVANIENFYADFTQGGWLAYNELWQPNNNYYGQMLMIHDETLRRVAAAQLAAQNEAIASQGFLSSKRCIATDNDQYASCIDTGGTDAQCKKAACTKYEIVTPGSVVGGAVVKAVGMEGDWAVNIRSWTSALVNALISRLAKEGLSLLKGSQDSSSGGGGINPSYSQYILTTAAAPYEGGSVSGSGVYNLSSSATATAIANSGYVFISWSGDATGISSTTRVFMDRDKFAVANFAPSGVYPPAPDGLNVTCTSNNSATISWNESPGAFKYAVRIDNNSNSWSNDCSKPNPGDSCQDTTATVENIAVTPDEYYSWWVHGCNDKGCGEAANGNKFICGGTRY